MQILMSLFDLSKKEIVIILYGTKGTGSVTNTRGISKDFDLNTASFLGSSIRQMPIIKHSLCKIIGICLTQCMSMYGRGYHLHSYNMRRTRFHCGIEIHYFLLAQFPGLSQAFQ